MTLNLASSAARRREWLSQTRLAVTFERRLGAKLVAEFTRVGRRAAAQVSATGAVAVPELLAAHKRSLEAILAPFYAAVVKTWIGRVEELAGGKSAGAPRRKMTEAQTDAFLARFVRATMPKRVDGIATTTLDRVTRVVARGAREQWSHSMIADAIVERSGGAIGEARALTIARTEVHAASQAGALEAGRELGLPKLRKEWIATNDDRTRDTHSSADGQVVGLDEAFDVAGAKLMFPGDPDGPAEEIVNCRCVMAFTTEE